MKRFIITLVVLAAFASVASAAGTVVGSKHDLRAVGGGTATGTGLVQVCVVCHTPHQATAANAQDPLWNHTGTATAAFGVYGSSTMNAVPAEIGGTAMGGQSVSLLCMSCHDGTVSVLSMYKAPVLGGTPTAAAVAGRISAAGLIISGANVGTNLTDDHPVNFTYNAALATADGGLVTPASAGCVTGAPCSIPLFTQGAALSTVQCASCHDVHDPTNIPFLRMDNTGSALCRACHIK